MNRKKIINSLFILVVLFTTTSAISFTQKYVEKVNIILLDLDITYETVINKTGGKLQFEADTLISVGKDIYGREQRMRPEAAQALEKMIRAAKKDRVNLYLVSCYRSVKYQSEIIKRKLGHRQGLESILKVNAIPGFSEHHTGNAVDFHTDYVTVLEEDFKDTRAYRWLKKNANKFGFRETYPENNVKGITFEPWHWYYFK